MPYYTTLLVLKFQDYARRSRRVVKLLNLALRFLLELCALAALVYWGFHSAQGALLKVILGIGVPLLAATAWGTFRVPDDPGKAPVAVPGKVRLLLELVFWSAAVAGLAGAGQVTLAWVFGLLVVVNNALMPERLLRLWRFTL
jgi:hypothetical protein